MNNGFANVLRGQNPLQLTAAPLAAAIRAAHERHAPRAAPLPQAVREGLQEHFSAQVLTVAKFAVGTVEITLPNFIGKGAAFMGDDYAVVVDDTIVFNDNPPSFSENPGWWAHEVQHVAQYSRMGVEVFAYRYLRDLGTALEAEAEAAARKVGGVGHDEGAGHVALSAQLGQIAQTPTAAQVGLKGAGIEGVQRVPEFFVSQCVFPADPAPVHYMLTNTGKVIAVNVFDGTYLHVAWATPPLLPGVSWTYQTRNFRYAVMPDGSICTPAQFGGWMQIGHVVRWQ